MISGVSAPSAAARMARACSSCIVPARRSNCGPSAQVTVLARAMMSSVVMRVAVPEAQPWTPLARTSMRTSPFPGTGAAICSY
ncbi:hypothetical protein AB0J14_23870 [Micromonospora arborensis]|uniref:hypothetical protein n=1 Tax=Micromonospora arborensis TaxID=2116518 RepID=UPI0033D82994